jgi:hypothetical protein
VWEGQLGQLSLVAEGMHGGLSYEYQVDILQSRSRLWEGGQVAAVQSGRVTASAVEGKYTSSRVKDTERVHIANQGRRSSKGKGTSRGQAKVV